MALFLEFFRYIRVQARISEGDGRNVALKKSGSTCAPGANLFVPSPLYWYSRAERKSHGATNRFFGFRGEGASNAP